jgi:hypothetical protein
VHNIVCSSRKCLFYSSLRCTCSVHVCLQELLCCTWTCLSPRACAAAWRWMGCKSLFLFCILLVCFERFFHFGCFDTGPKQSNKPKQTKNVFGFTKPTEKQPKQIEFCFVLFPTENIFFSFRGQPSSIPSWIRAHESGAGERIQAKDQVHLCPDPKHYNKQKIGYFSGAFSFKRRYCCWNATNVPGSRKVFYEVYTRKTSSC